MKKLQILLTFLPLVFYCNLPQVPAQKKPREVVIIKVFVPPSIDADIFEVPLNRRMNEKKYILQEIHSIQTTPAHQLIRKGYIFFSKGYAIEGNKAKIILSIAFTESFNRKCNIKRNLFIIGNEQTTLKLNCGVNLTAYYDSESAE
jgi:hypothetical protein